VELAKVAVLTLVLCFDLVVGHDFQVEEMYNRSLKAVAPAAKVCVHLQYRAWAAMGAACFRTVDCVLFAESACVRGVGLCLQRGKEKYDSTTNQQGPVA
jgi:hypothetical protein